MPRTSPTSPTSAMAGTWSWPGPWARVAECAELGLPLARRNGHVVIWKRASDDRGARGAATRRSDSARRDHPGGRRRDRRASSSSQRGARSALPAAAWSSSARSARLLIGIRAHPARGAARRYPDRRCGSPCCLTSTATCPRSKQCSRRSSRTTPSGSSATSWATARSPTRSSPDSRRRMRRACAAITTRRRSACSTPTRFNDDARAARRVDD